jgi:hypothetical protein
MSQSQPFRDHVALYGAAALLLAIGLALQSPAAATQGTPTNPQNPLAGVPRALPAFATADSNGTMIAVTGIDLTGQSVLYLVDTAQKQLAIYQASSGSDATQGVRLIGARKIDLDLQLEGYNDRSQYSYEELEKRFQANK